MKAQRGDVIFVRHWSHVGIYANVTGYFQNAGLITPAHAFRDSPAREIRRNRKPRRPRVERRRRVHQDG